MVININFEARLLHKKLFKIYLMQNGVNSKNFIIFEYNLNYSLQKNLFLHFFQNY